MNIRDFNQRSICSYIGILVLLFSSCNGKKNKVDPNLDFFPPVFVDFYVNLSLPDAAALQFPQGWIYRNGGNKGIIIYNTGFEGPDKFQAYDRTCPYKPDSTCSYVSVDSNSVYFVCGQYNPNFKPCCGSKFYANGASPFFGPASRALHSYFVRQEGNALRISNSPI